MTAFIEKVGRSYMSLEDVAFVGNGIGKNYLKKTTDMTFVLYHHNSFSCSTMSLCFV